MVILPSLGLPAVALAQTHQDVLRGAVTTDIGTAIAGADVIITMAPDRDSRSSKTDAEGHYSITFEKGTGDYLVHISALGRATFRKRVTRVGTDSVFVVDAKLAIAGVQQLSTVNVSARKPKPSRGGEMPNGAGASEKVADGVNGAVSPDMAGDLNAISATIPGITATSGGVSVAGLSPSNNSTTLNGMWFPGADVPRDASTRVRVSTSTYDPARGWFSGVNQNVELSPGNIFSSRRGHLTLDVPALQYTDPISAKLGQRFTNVQASLGGDGSFEGDNFVYNYGLQGSHRMADAVSISGAGADVLQRAGLSSDSAARFLSLLNAAGIPITGRGVPSSQINQSASFIGRIDHAPYDWKTFAPSKTMWGLQAYAKLASSGAVQTSPTGTAAHTGKTSLGIGSLQAMYSTYFGNDYLTENRSSISVMDNRATPYTRLPDGRVLVTSAFPDGTGGVTSLGFGGNSSLWSNSRQWTWETMSETQFYPPGNTSHRVKLTADSRLDGVRQDVNSNSLGIFSFNSLGDLAANQPSSFIRTLTQPTRTGGEWNWFAALGDVWRKSPAIQLMYGARIEANRFTSTPAYNPAIDAAFGERTDNAPNTYHLSPRLGFTWVRRSAFGDGFGVAHMITPIGSFYPAPTSYIRGGIGEFRSLISPSLLTRASAATGLPNGMQSLACVGSATPTPSWSDYAANAATVPDQCAGQSAIPVFTDASPAVQLYDRNYTAPRSWRGNLSYASSFHTIPYSVEGVYSLNLNQPGIRDLNFGNTARFTTTDEGRPVFVNQSSVVPTTGALSTVDARKDASFGHVIDNVSNLTSFAKQLTFAVTPPVTQRGFLSLGYTLGSVNAQTRGFDGSTFGNPSARESARGDLDVRHQFLVQAGYVLKRTTFTLFGRFQSGLPYTPMVGGDVNGDGFANDRAYIFNPATATDPALATSMRSLFATSSGSVRDCLTRQLGRAAGKNSCEGPWTAMLNAQLAFDFTLPGTSRRTNVALAFANPLGGIDQLIHGADHLRGWGSPAMPDPVLYNVRGFDATNNRFKYDVNPRFGNTSPANTTFRSPFRVTLDVRFDLGTSLPQQQLGRWLKPGRAGRPGPRLSAAELKRRYARNVPNPYARILQETDSLLLTRDQVEAIQRVQTTYVQRMDSLWTSLADYLAGLGDQFNSAEALKRQESATDDAWELSRADIQRTLPTILSPVQLQLLPFPADLLYKSKDKLVGIRIFMNGP